MVFLLTQLSLAQPECVDLHMLIEQSTSSLFLGDLRSSQDGIELIEERFKCAIPPDVDTLREDIGDYILLKAYMAHLQEENDQRDQWLQQVRNMEYWNPNFGLEIEAALQQISIQSSFVLNTQPNTFPSGVHLWIDGSDTIPPVEVVPGIHWLWLTQDDVVVWSAVDYFAANDSIVLPEVVPRPSANPSIMASAVFLGVSAITAHVIASLHHKQMMNATTMVELDHSFQRSQVWGWSSVVLLGSSSVFTLKWLKEQRDKNES